MTDAGLRTVRFVSDALPDDTFDLLDLHGLEELNRLFSFHLRLAVREPARVRGQTHALLEAPAFLVFFDDGQEVRRVHGVLSDLALDLDVELDQAELSVTLVPRLWALTQRQATELALDKTVPQLLVERLSRLGLKEGDDFQLRLLGRHETREMVVQHQESDWAFLCRLCEQVGIFFAFAHASGRDVVVFGDQPDELWGSAPVVVPYRRRGDTRGAFAVRDEVRRGPSAVQLGDYNYRLPGVGLRGQHEVEGPGGWGVQRLWGEHVKTPEEAEARAEVRAQQSAQERVRVSGQTTELALTAGSVLVLAEPLGTERRVLVTRLATHVSVTLGPDGALQATSETSFDGLPEGVAFRPERRTPWPKVPGLVHAVVDGAADGTYAELDEQGRYQVVFGHDATTQGAMRRSRPVRMLQPHGGPDHGMHFPLRPGTEVLVGHVEGDPDRPVIVGVAPNPSVSSPVGAGNATQNVLRSGSRNELVMEDQQGQERVRLHSPYRNSLLQLGSVEEPEDGVMVQTDGHVSTVARKAITESSERRTSVTGMTSTLVGSSSLVLAGLERLEPPNETPSDSGATATETLRERASRMQQKLRLLALGWDPANQEGFAREGNGPGPLVSDQGQSLERSASMAAALAVQQRAEQSQQDAISSHARTQGLCVGPLDDPSVIVGSTASATLFGKERVFVFGDEAVTMASAHTARVVASQKVDIQSPEQIEIAGARALRLTSASRLDLWGGQVLVRAGGGAEQSFEAPPDDISLAMLAEKTIRTKSVAGGWSTCAELDVVLHSHQKSVKVVAKSAVSLRGGSIDCSAGGTVSVSGHDIKLKASGDLEAKAAGSLTLKSDATVTIEGATIVLRAGTIVLEGTTTVKGHLAVTDGISG